MVELARLVDVLELAGMGLDEVEIPLEDEAASAGGNHADLVAGLEPGLLQSLNRQSRLMLRTDPSEPSPPFL